MLIILDIYLKSLCRYSVAYARTEIKVWFVENRNIYAQIVSEIVFTQKKSILIYKLKPKFDFLFTLTNQRLRLDNK